MLSSRRSSRRIRRILGGAMVSFNLFAFPSNISSVNYELKDGTVHISGQGVVTEHWVKKLPEYYDILRFNHPNDYTVHDEGLNPEYADLRDSVKHVIIDNGVTEIGERAFYDFTNLEDVSIPDTVKKIGEQAFDHCSALSEIKIPSTVEEIGDEAFYSCESLKKCSLGRIKKIGIRAFSYCLSLPEIEIPSTVEEIGTYAFDHCISLVQCRILGRLKKMGNRVFCDCQSLVKFDVSNSASIEKIGRNVCVGCTSLATIPQIFKNSTHQSYDDCINLIDQ